MKLPYLGHYILSDDDKRPIPCDLFTWGRWFEDHDRHVGSDRVGGLWLSTVFLGLDHRFSDEGPPILFETMLFDEVNLVPSFGDTMVAPEVPGYTRRYATYEEAKAGHAEMLLLLQVNEELKAKRP